jgi:ATP phosphoribosyltransferase
MAALSNPFFGIDVGTLNTLKTKTLEAIQAVLLNQSYSLNGKSVNRADLDKLNMMLGQLQSAIDDANGTTTTTSFVSFNGF